METLYGPYHREASLAGAKAMPAGRRPTTWPSRIFPLAHNPDAMYDCTRFGV
jgi:hypothetical protein